jgi:antitoxin VapB
MSLNIKNRETHKLVQSLAKKTGETLTEAVTTAVRERLERLDREQRVDDRVRDVMAISRRFSKLLKGKKIDIDSELYDENGLPK